MSHNIIPDQPDQEAPRQTRAARPNQWIAGALVLLVAGMVGLSYAAVPLYRMFCQATGFGGTTQRANTASREVSSQLITVRFDANVGQGLKWTFEPVQREMTVHIGENALAFFRATNLSNVPITGTAKYNVVPEIMGGYFTKIQCFCFEAQTLKPGETVEMPVSFYIDPSMLKDRDIKNTPEVTLSYTFYPASEQPVGAKT